MNASKTRDPRQWRRWAESGAVSDGPLMLVTMCARSWAVTARVVTPRRGDSWPAYAARAAVEIDAACVRLAVAHGGRAPDGICPKCGGTGDDWSCWRSGRTRGPDRKRMEAFFRGAARQRAREAFDR